MQRKYLNSIRPEYSRVYRIKDSVVVTAQTKNNPTTPSSYPSWPRPTQPPTPKSRRREDKKTSDLMLSDEDKESGGFQSGAVMVAQSGASSTRTTASEVALATAASMGIITLLRRRS